jgi:hypothetical protein
MRAFLLALTCAFALLAAAMAPTRGDAEGAAKITEFFGQFKGQGIAKDRDNKVFDRSLRDLDTTVEPAGEGGFTVKWTTVIRDGEGGKKTDNTLSFAPSGKLNVFKAPRATMPGPASMGGRSRSTCSRWATKGPGAGRSMSGASPATAWNSPSAGLTLRVRCALCPAN